MIDSKEILHIQFPRRWPAPQFSTRLLHRLTSKNPYSNGLQPTLEFRECKVADVCEVVDVCEVADVCEVVDVCKVSDASLLADADLIKDASIVSDAS